MRKILIAVEGQTEERFVKDILNPFFNAKDLYLIPTVVNTKVVKGGPNFKGGINSYTIVKKDINNLLKDSSAIAVTTMFDFYALPTDFPTWYNSGTCYDKVKSAEDALSNDINHKKFMPYLSLHEFEGLLFSAPDIISNTIDRSKKESIQSIRDAFSSPEEINQGVFTKPSARLLKIFPNYKKPLHGSLIAQRTGLDLIQSSCPHFNDWISKIKIL